MLDKLQDVVGKVSWKLDLEDPSDLLVVPALELLHSLSLYKSVAVTVLAEQRMELRRDGVLPTKQVVRLYNETVMHVVL
jgi:hypothetical protein